VDTSAIKVKEIPTDLSDEEAEEQTKNDAVEYLTVVSYILLSHSPVRISDEGSFQQFALDSATRALIGITTGDYNFLDGIESRSQKALEEINAVEVPESMLETHAKAIKILTYASDMKASVKRTVSPDDPLAQMYALGRFQGLILTLQQYVEELQGKLVQYGINSIPLDI
jgi:hypothetical protein